MLENDKNSAWHRPSSFRGGLRGNGVGEHIDTGSEHDIDARAVLRAGKNRLPKTDSGAPDNEERRRQQEPRLARISRLLSCD